MSTTPTPRRIEWAGPEGWTVWADEDGVHLRTPKGDSLECPSVDLLIDLINTARSQVVADHVPAPKPPTREEMRHQSMQRNDQYTLRRAWNALRAELAPDLDAPPF